MLCLAYQYCVLNLCFFFFKQKTAYEMRISDWSSDVCSSDLLIDYALAYHRDVVAPTLQRRAPEGAEIDGLRRLDADLAALPATATAEEIQNLVYEIGKTGGFESLRDCEIGRAWCRDRVCQSV